MPRITYRELCGYKYQLVDTYRHETGIECETPLVTSGSWVKLSREGKLTLKRGYCWDGPSGPTIDTPDFLRGSLVHDALYQLMRERLLPGRTRKRADEILWMICLADGMPKARADYVYHAVRVFAGYAARPPRSQPRRRLYAP